MRRPCAWLLLVPILVSLHMPVWAGDAPVPGGNGPAVVRDKPDLDALLDQLGEQLELIRAVVAMERSERAQGPAFGSGTDTGAIDALRARVAELLLQNEALLADLKLERQRRESLLHEVAELRTRLDKAEAALNEGEDLAVQLDTALVLIDSYEKAMAGLNARISELEGRLPGASIPGE